DFARLAVYRVQSPPYTDEAMSTQATTPRTMPRRGRLMATLFAAQVCGSTGHSIGMAIGGILAAGISGTNTSSGMPVAVGALRAREPLALGADGPLGASGGAGAGLRPGRARRARGDVGRDDPQLCVAARRHGPLRRLPDVELTRTLRRGRRQFRRPAGPHDGL